MDRSESLSSVESPRFVFAGERERLAAAEEALFPVLSVVCDACHRELPLRAGLGALDTLWMHERRCPAAEEALFPELSLVCDACADPLPLGTGLGPVETLWMHEHDCPAAAPALALDAGDEPELPRAAATESFACAAG
jgi:hypothetical protein